MKTHARGSFFLAYRTTRATVAVAFSFFLDKNIISVNQGASLKGTRKLLQNYGSTLLWGRCLGCGVNLFNTALHRARNLSLFQVIFIHIGSAVLNGLRARFSPQD